MSTSEWERITYGRQTVYWKRDLPDGSYLAVKRMEDGRYKWGRRGPDFRHGADSGAYELHEYGFAGTVPAARRAADRAARAVAVEITDQYGRVWRLPIGELCPTCLQPDNCGDCTHGRLSDDEVLALGGRLAGDVAPRH